MDIRQGVLVKSEDQGEELLSSCIVDRRLVIGSEKGFLRVWQVGSWDDNEQTVAVAGKGASADGLGAEGQNSMVAVGSDDGVVRFVDMSTKRPKVLQDAEVRHDEVEGVLGLGFEVGGRMISGGGHVVKVWEDSDKVDDGEDEEGSHEGLGGTNGKRANGFGSDQDESEEDGKESSDEEQQTKKKKKKKRKRSKDKNKNGAQRHVIAFKGMD